MSDSSNQKRGYRLGRRAETADETRRRIVEATYALHAERGIAGTSMKDIAARAGVSVGTVYHHFPTYPDAIAACGAHTAETVPAPADAIFAGASDRSERVERLVTALFDYYERVPALASVRSDRHIAPALEEFAGHEARNRLRLAARAIGARGRDRSAAVVAALVDLEVFRALLRQGLNLTQATNQVAAIVNCWLDHTQQSSHQ